MNDKTKKGFALFSVMMLLVAIMPFAVYLVAKREDAVARVTLSVWQRQAAQYALNITEGFMRAIVLDDNLYDATTDWWFFGFPRYMTTPDHYDISFRVTPSNARINLTQLLGRPGYEEFLTQQTERQPEEPLFPLAAFLDWVDSDDVTRPGGAEKDEYLRANKNYCPRNAPLIRYAEAKMVQGFTQRDVDLLREVVSIGQTEKLNINFANEEQIAFLTDRPSLAAQIIGERTSGPIQAVVDILNLDPTIEADEYAAIEGLLGVRSDRFELDMEVVRSGIIFRYFIIVERTFNRSARIVLWQEIR